MSKSITDLRDVLLATLEAVKAGTMDIDQARAVNELGKTICDTAKVEVDFAKVTGARTSGFLAAPTTAAELPPGITGITQHRLQG